MNWLAVVLGPLLRGVAVMQLSLGVGVGAILLTALRGLLPPR